MQSETEIRHIRSGAAAISQLLASGNLDEYEWELVAQLLVSCRRARMELEAAEE